MKEKDVKFRKYDEIDNHDRKKTINFYIEKGFVRGEWIGEEKANGSNLLLCIYLDEDLNELQVKFGRRQDFLEEGESFFGLHELKPSLIEKARALWIAMERKEMITKEDIIYCYGELIGGFYPTMNEKGKQKVQSGNYYSPDKRFYGFDIFLRGTYINRNMRNYLFKEAGILYLEPLVRGTFEECLNFDIYVPSQIPKALGLPTIESNLIEGIVLKPIIPIEHEGDMIALKKKDEELLRKARTKGSKQKKEETPLSDAGQDLLEKGRHYLTESRINDLFSKLGEFTIKRFGEFVGEFKKDVFSDFNKYHEDEFTALDKEEQKLIYKHLGTEASDFIRPTLRKEM